MKEQILKLKKEGLSLRKIAEKLNISFSKVAYHASPNYKEKSQLRWKTFNKRIRQQVLDIKKQMGAKCSICGYEKYIEILEFHHLDPLKKDFEIGKFYKQDALLLRKEAAKCNLVCPTCHRELHFLSKEIKRG